MSEIELYYYIEPDDIWYPVALEWISFPAGEVQLKTAPYKEADHYKILLRSADSKTIVASTILVHWLRRNAPTFVPIEIVAPYLPASRSDRGEFSTLGHYLDLLSHNGVSITTLDVHNLDAEAFSRSSAFVTYYPISSILPKDKLKDKYYGVIAPDKGAHGRASDAAYELDVPWIFHGHKERDFDTGKLTGFSFQEDVPKSARYLVIDDICDGGGSFAGLAQASGIPKENLDLWVTHGVFSGNYMQKLIPYYNKVYTTNSLVTVEHARINAAFGPEPQFIDITDIRPLMIGKIQK